MSLEPTVASDAPVPPRIPAPAGGGRSAYAGDVLKRLASVRRASRLYPLEHPTIQQAILGLEMSLLELQRAGASPEFAFYEGEVMLGDALLVEESLQFDGLVRELTEIGVGSVLFRPGLTRDELTRAIGVLASDPKEVERAGGLRVLIEAAELTGIDIGAVKAFDRFAADGEPTEAAREAYNAALALMREIDEVVKGSRALNARAVKGTVKSLVDNIITNRSAMLQLTGLRSYDEYTFYHSANVATLALAIGSQISTDSGFLTSLGTGALLHDIGKLAVDSDVLNKPGSLTTDEWAQVREHPVRGAQIAASTPGMDRCALVTILEHHMRYDGLGYPQRSPRRPQHIASRIVAVADSYDAMTSRRSYSAPRANDEAMALLVQSSGTGLDPALVRVFVRLMGAYPPRTAVRLDTGEIAIVLEAGANPGKPLLRVISDGSGAGVTPFDVDLSFDAERRVLACVDPGTLSVDVEDFL